MNISYAPFDSEPPQVVQKFPVADVHVKKATKKAKVQEKKLPGPEGTECNYVVLAFVFGILYLLMTTSD